MLEPKSQKIVDILFNGNVRSQTREAVLLAALKRLNVDEDVFLGVLGQESQNSKNIKKDGRERDRNSNEESNSLQEREMRLMRGAAPI